jgi:hypothetical protein
LNILTTFFAACFTASTDPCLESFAPEPVAVVSFCFSSSFFPRSLSNESDAKSYAFPRHGIDQRKPYVMARYAYSKNGIAPSQHSSRSCANGNIQRASSQASVQQDAGDSLSAGKEQTGNTSAAVRGLRLQTLQPWPSRTPRSGWQ